MTSPAPIARLDTVEDERLLQYVQRTGAPARFELPAPETRVPLVTFLLDGQAYALPVERVREVVRPDHLTPVPQAPRHVRGVQSIRGRVLPVLEVRTRLELPALALGPTARILVVEGHQRLLGLLVDEVEKVLTVPRSAIREPPPEVKSRLSRHVVGVVQTGARLALLLDIDALLLLPVTPHEVEVP